MLFSDANSSQANVQVHQLTVRGRLKWDRTLRSLASHGNFQFEANFYIFRIKVSISNMNSLMIESSMTTKIHIKLPCPNQHES